MLGLKDEKELSVHQSLEQKILMVQKIQSFSNTFFSSSFMESEPSLLYPTTSILFTATVISSILDLLHNNINDIMNYGIYQIYFPPVHQSLGQKILIVQKILITFFISFFMESKLSSFIPLYPSYSRQK